MPSRGDVQGVNWLKNVAEALAFSDSNVNASGTSYYDGESLVLTDTRISNVVAYRTDTLALSDSSANNTVNIRTETIALSDSMLFGSLKNLTESLTITANNTFYTLKHLSDSLALTDYDFRAVVLYKSESTSIIDSSIRVAIHGPTNYVLNVSESFGITDTKKQTPELNGALYSFNYILTDDVSDTFNIE